MEKAIHDLNCLQCGVAFAKPWKMKRPFCSKQCRSQWNRKRRTKHCQICGYAFVSTSKNAKFCSLKCVAKHNEIGNATCCQCGVDIGRPVKNNAKRSHCGTYCQRLSQLKSRTCELCPHCYGKPKVGCCEATKREHVERKRDPWEVALSRAWQRRRRTDNQCPWAKKLYSCAGTLKYRRFECGSNKGRSSTKGKTWEQALKIPSRVDPWRKKMHNKARNMAKRRRRVNARLAQADN